MQLKDELEKDESFTVFEVDMLDEYEQLVENLPDSMTFSSDLKKTAQYLELTKKVVTKRCHHNMLVSKIVPSGLVMSRMQKNGLNDFLSDFTQIKSLMLKVNFFFKNVKNVASKDLSINSKGTAKIDTQSLQRIERLVAEQSETRSRVAEELTQDMPLKNTSVENEDEKYLGQISEKESLSKVEDDPLETNPFVGKIWAPQDKPLQLVTSEDDTNPVDELEIAQKIIKSKKASEIKALLELPEINFYPGTKVLDPVAFFMEIFFNRTSTEFKKKFLKMSLLKVYQTQFYITDEYGIWEEGTPLELKAINILDHSVSCWINEGRNTDFNIFILPVFVDDKFSSGIGLMVNGSVGHEKMTEMEFWCYLGRCACS